MKKSGLADSPFFAKSQNKNEVPTPPLANPPVQQEKPQKIEKPLEQKSEQPSNNDTTTPRLHDTTLPSNHDTVIPRHHGTIVELVRKAVKEVGKEAATHRFTETEKKELADLIYTYKNRGVKTSENEITRIAVNFILEDYKENGENSILHKILEALNE